MKNEVILCACALLAFGCQGKQDEYVVDMKESVSLNVFLSCGETKGIEEEMAVHDVQVFIFDESGTLESYSHEEAGQTSVSLRCTPGKKNVVALVNAPSMSSISSYMELSAMESDLIEDNQHGNLLMSGEKMCSLISGQDAQEISVEVGRKVAKIVLNSLKVNLDTEHYVDDGFYFCGVYLVNVPGAMPYLGNGDADVWYNRGCLEDNGMSPVLSNIFDQPVQIYNTETHSGDYVFYSYPNSKEDTSVQPWTPRATRLVVEAKLGEVRYFYPVTIPSVVSDYVYKVNLTVRRPGSSSADDPVEVLDITGSVIVEEWVKTDVIDAEI